MKPFHAVGLLLLCSVASAQEPAEKPGLAGKWEGTLEIGALKLRLGFDVLPGKNKGFDTTLVSIDQGGAKIPVTTTLDGAEVRFEAKAVNADFRGKLSDDRQSIAGTFTQGLPVPLTLKRVATFAVVKRPQHPTPPFPYVTEEVTVENAGAKLTLAGTFTKPKGDGPFPAVVFITGSGPQNRDEELLGHRPFLVIADRLTKEGFATLRCDDRGVGKSTGKFADATSADFATDALACVKWLANRADVRKDAIGVLGHSEGGLVGPMAAAQTREIAFVVMLAGPGVSGDKIIAAQGDLITEKSGVSGDLPKLASRLRKRAAALVREDASDADLAKAIDEELEAWKKLGRPQAEIDAVRVQSKQFGAPWFRYFLKHDPAPTLRQLKVPVLALFGELDLQVPAEENAAAVSAALKAGGNKNAAVETLPKLNHLFQRAVTGLPNEYGQIEETIAPAALDRIAGWLKERIAEKR